MMFRGVFWFIHGKLICYPFDGSFSEGIAKSGNTYNHKKLWPFVRPKYCNVPYNYYPRGRVDISPKDKAIIYLSPQIGTEFIPQIKKAFAIDTEPIVKYDHSKHYHCYIDKQMQ